MSIFFSGAHKVKVIVKDNINFTANIIVIINDNVMDFVPVKIFCYKVSE